MKHALAPFPWGKASTRDLTEALRTESPTMERVVDAVRSVASTAATVLLTGSTGTGKGVFARAIHQLSPRRTGPFVVVHCAAIPETLIEAELFGHEKGAFTGADQLRLGRFEEASGGTLLLDEVGTFSAGVQVKLLRVLQEGTIRRIGSGCDIDIDVRVIAATNADLKELVRAGTFRSDLYYRLCVFPIELPPLRDRREDVPHLVRLILERLNRIYGRSISGASEGVIRVFREYDWPGNIRELENIVERAYILESGHELTLDSIPIDIQVDMASATAVSITTEKTLSAVRRAALHRVECEYLTELLRQHNGRIGVAAGKAGVSTRQLHNLLTRHGITKASCRNQQRPL